MSNKYRDSPYIVFSMKGKAVTWIKRNQLVGHYPIYLDKELINNVNNGLLNIHASYPLTIVGWYVIDTRIRNHPKLYCNVIKEPYNIQPSKYEYTGDIYE